MKMRKKDDIIARLEAERERWEQLYYSMERTWARTEAAVPKWISVADQLPPSGDEVLLLFEDGTVEVRRIRAFPLPRLLTYSAKQGFFETQVAYWMPVPARPTGGAGRG